MGKRGKQTWSKKPLPVGAIKLRRRRRSSGKGWIKVRFIKVRDTGPKGRRWIPLAKFTWEETHGPVPRGKRVVHYDGNTLNDDPANYRLMTAGEVINLAHFLNPQMSEENRRGTRRRAATADHNRLRGRLRRAVSFLPSRWYLVDPVNRIVYGEPSRSRRKLAARVGIPIAVNGGIARRRLDSLPYKFCRGRELSDFGRGVFQQRSSLPIANPESSPC